MFENLVMPPPDKILALMPLFREDPREHKLDLGVGVYRNASGVTPIIAAVREAERLVLEEQTTKSYIGPAGDPAFCDLLTRLVFSDQAPLDRIRSIQTPGGAGALTILAGLIATTAPEATVLLPEPTWVNHLSIIEDSGLAMRSWPYLSQQSGGVDFEAMVAAVRSAKAGDVILLHGCCHNPTGTDLDEAQWRALGELLVQTGVIPWIDIAYQGFGASLYEDAFAVRHLASVVPEMLVASSCSKNFGIYRERTGAAMILGETPAQADIALAQMVVRARLCYSMPPDHGSRIVRTVLENEKLEGIWRAELDQMRANIVGLREALADAFLQRGADGRYEYLRTNKGMFSLLGITPTEAVRLRHESAVYVVEDGRINIAGLRHDQINDFADAVIAVTSRERFQQTPRSVANFGA